MSALVAKFLRSLWGKDAQFARLIDLQRRTLGEIGAFRAADRLKRDEVHDRAVR